MTIKISITKALPKTHRGVLHFPNTELEGWHLDLAYLLYLWELGQDTILETAFYEPFEKRIINSGFGLFD